MAVSVGRGPIQNGHVRDRTGPLSQTSVLSERDNQLHHVPLSQQAVVVYTSEHGGLFQKQSSRWEVCRTCGLKLAEV